MDNNMSYADFAAMSNNGANGQWNNPFIYLLWMMFFGNGGNGFGFGGGNAAANAAQFQNLSDLIQDNHNSDLTMQAIAGNTAAITQLASALNTSTDNVIGAINAMSTQMQQGNCQIKTEILNQGYQSRLDNCQQTNTILQQSQNIANIIQSGFAAQSTQIQLLGCEIEKTSIANTQRIIDTLNTHWSQEQQGLINSLQSQLSEQKILNAIAAKAATPTT